MPLYEYECANCHHRFEKIESYSAPEKQKCPKCGKVAKRLLAPPAIQFKGTGWYVTDYARKNSVPAPKSSRAPSSPSDGGSAKASSDQPGKGKGSTEKKA